ncbi:MAG: sulfite exporter TauE/SafE family protein, partial [Abditibacteriota bacterium]|nr:sulfite exporter TauE/SafE family protein [Abditibacteriota bacterium]
TIVVPLMVLLLGLEQKKAQGISLVCACLIALAALAPYTLHGNINFVFSLFIIGGAVCGSSIGSYIVKRIKTRPLRLIFIALLAYTALNMIYSGITGRGVFSPETNSVAGFWLYASLALLGLLSGTLSGLLGIGGGIVLVPCMLLLGLGQKTAQGISLLCMVPTALTGIYLQSRWGNVDFRAGLAAGVGAALFSVAGSSLAAYAHTRFLNIAFGVFMLLVTGLMIRTLLQGDKK